MTIRPAEPRDQDALTSMWLALCPSGTREEHADEIRSYFSGEIRSTLPLEILVAEGDTEGLAGCVEVGLRSTADGCDARRPVTYIEAWFVAPEYRRSGVGRALIEAAEEWGRSHGCVEVASDALVDNDTSQAAHLALGFEEVGRCVHYRKALGMKAL